MSSAVSSESPPAYVVSAASPVRSTRLGFVAMMLGLGVFVGSVAASVLMGFAAARYAINGPSGFSVYLRLDSGDPTETMLAVLALLHVLLGTGLGLWALTQGIVAIATNRGRAFGVVALVAAVLAPGASLVVYMGIALSNATS